MRKDAVAAKNNGGVEVGSNNGASEPFLKATPKEDEEEMEKEQRQKKEVRAPNKVDKVVLLYLH